MRNRDLFTELSSALAEAKEHSEGKLTLKYIRPRFIRSLQPTRSLHSAFQSFSKSK